MACNTSAALHGIMGSLTNEGSMQYREYLTSDDWLTKRYLKKLRVNNCGICGSTDNLDVHHLNYRNLIDVQMSDLRVLCRRCHFLAHRLHQEGKIRFRSTDHNSRFASIKNTVKRELKIQQQNMFH